MEGSGTQLVCETKQTMYLIREFEVRLISQTGLAVQSMQVSVYISYFENIMNAGCTLVYCWEYVKISQEWSLQRPTGAQRTQREAGRPLAGDKGGQLLDADRLPGVEEVVHVPDGLLARRLCRGGVVWFTLGALLGVFVVALESWLPRLSDILLVLIENTDASILSYPVADLSWIDPHGQLAGKYLVQELWRQATVVSCLTDDGIHLAVDSDASVPGALEWLLREPVVAVPAAEDLYQGVAKFSQLSLAYISFTEPYEMDQKIRGGLHF